MSNIQFATYTRPKSGDNSIYCNITHPLCDGEECRTECYFFSMDLNVFCVPTRLLILIPLRSKNVTFRDMVRSDIQWCHWSREECDIARRNFRSSDNKYLVNPDEYTLSTNSISTTKTKIYRQYYGGSSWFANNARDFCYRMNRSRTKGGAGGLVHWLGSLRPSCWTPPSLTQLEVPDNEGFVRKWCLRKGENDKGNNKLFLS